MIHHEKTSARFPIDTNSIEINLFQYSKKHNECEKKKKRKELSIKTHSQIIILSKKKYSIKKIAQKRSFCEK